MKAYSLDLRERIVEACAQPKAKIYQVAIRFGVSLSFANKLLRRHRTSGSLAALPARGGPAPRLDETGQQRLLACLRAQPDATLQELATALAKAGGPTLSISSLWHAVKALGWSRKKKSLHAAERDTERVAGLRRQFLEDLQGEDFTRLVFLDETSTNLSYTRRYGRAPGGKRVDQAVPLHNGPNITLLAALTCQGLGAMMSVEGAVNGAVFRAYLAQVLGPSLQPGDVIVLDNVPVHKVAGVAQIASKYGARLLYLPPYSPDFNPIELAFSKLKTWLRTARARCGELLEEAIRSAAADYISEGDVKNWFDHCGYHVH